MSAISQSLLFTPASSVGSTATVEVVYPNNTSTTQTYLSEKAKGDGYYGASDGLHTVMYVASLDFIGTMTIQASLATDPIEADWFNVENVSTTYTSFDDRNTHTVDSHNFTGNFVWVRGNIMIESGVVLMIQYNH